MKNLIRLLILGPILIAFVISCSGPPRIGYKTAANLYKGEDYTKVLTYLDREPKEEREIVLKPSNDKYKYLVYKRMVIVQDDYYIFFPDKYDLFCLAFKDDKLYFWGNLDDFKVSDDLIANKIGDSISDFILNGEGGN